MTDSAKECRRCQKSWPGGCDCDDGGRPDPLGHQRDALVTAITPMRARNESQAIAVLKQQLRNIDHALSGIVEDWYTRAKALLDAETLEKLAKNGEWSVIEHRRGTAEGLCRAAADLKLYVDTWADP